MWDKLPQDVQFSANIFEFKKNISTMYKTYNETNQSSKLL